VTAKKVLSIGQCFADHAAIAHRLNRDFGADVVAASDWVEALSLLRSESFALVLVNRLLDADGSPGLDVIKELKSDETFRALPVLLVSNHEQAQCEAVQAGAEIGFGKGDLGQPAMLGRVRPFLA
jgi:DNA-binding response OmpR family regulator